MLHIVESRKPLDRVVRDLDAAVVRHKFGGLGVHDLRAKMADKGVVFETNLEISTALPCRISVYEEGGVTKLATIKPTAMLDLYSTAGLEGVAREVEAALTAIMAEAAAD